MTPVFALGHQAVRPNGRPRPKATLRQGAFGRGPRATHLGIMPYQKIHWRIKNNTAEITAQKTGRFHSGKCPSPGSSVQP